MELFSTVMGTKDSYMWEIKYKNFIDRMCVCMCVCFISLRNDRNPNFLRLGTLKMCGEVIFNGGITSPSPSGMYFTLLDSG